MSLYRKNFLTKDHSYYNDRSLFLHQIIQGDRYVFEYALYSFSGERFENMVKLNWPNVKLDRTYGLPYYDCGFDILGPGSVHGVLCLLCLFRRNIVLWNPSTKEFNVIPPSPFDCGVDAEYWVDHREFGYDSIRDDYKVLLHLRFILMNNCETDMLSEDDILIWEIYSLRSNSWKILDIDMHHNHSMNCGQVYMDGRTHSICKDEKPYLLSFDWGSEEFLTTPLPSDMDDIGNLWIVKTNLMLLNGSIALILHYEETDAFHVSILGEFGVKESWTKIFISESLPCLEYAIGVGKNNDILFKKKDYNLTWFDLNTQKIEDLGIISNRFATKIVVHQENLVSSKGKSI